MSEDGARRDLAGRRLFSRRRLLALAGAGVAGSFAGCGSSSDGTDTAPGTATGNETPTGSPAAGLDTDTATDSHTATSTPAETATDTATETATQTAASVDIEVPEGGSYFGPGDGFAEAAPWLEEEDVDVHVVSEPTLDAFNEAVNAPGPRVVVFETSGTINLQERRFTVGTDKLYLAGQTAPSPGITLTHGDFWIDANDCVVQHLRVRPGDAGNESDWEPDTIRTADGSRNNVIDHCTATWSVDENVSPGYDSRRTTISNSIIAEALNDASHHKGPHAYGLLVGDGATDVAIIGNLLAHNTARNPRLKAETKSVVVNNVMHHFDEAVNLDRSTESAIVGNAFLQADEDDANIEGGKVYHDDNVTDGDAKMVADVNSYAGRPLWPVGLEPMAGDRVVDHNLSYVGARPADRTEHDSRVVEQVRNRDGGYVDSQDDVGGYPDLPENTHSLDVPDAGLREWLQAWAVAVEEPGVSPP